MLYGLDLVESEWDGIAGLEQTIKFYGFLWLSWVFTAT